MSEESKATTFGARVKEVREELGISVQDACNRSGMEISEWSNVEENIVFPKVKTVWLMAIALDVRPHNLLV